MLTQLVKASCLLRIFPVQVRQNKRHNHKCLVAVVLWKRGKKKENHNKKVWWLQSFQIQIRLFSELSSKVHKMEQFFIPTPNKKGFEKTWQQLRVQERHAGAATNNTRKTNLFFQEEPLLHFFVWRTQNVVSSLLVQSPLSIGSHMFVSMVWLKDHHEQNGHYLALFFAPKSTRATMEFPLRNVQQQLLKQFSKSITLSFFVVFSSVCNKMWIFLF